MAENNNENTLYQRWRDAQSDDERLEIENLLFRAIRRHAAAVVWQELQESNDVLVASIAGDALSGLSEFTGRSMLSTWVHAIAKKQARQEKRRRSRYRRVFAEKANIVEIPLGPSDVQEPHQPACPEEWFALMRFRDNLREDGIRLLDGVLEGKDQGELAQDLGISAEAAQTRRRRLMAELCNFLEL